MFFSEVPTHELFDRGQWWMPYAARVAKREGHDPQAFIWEAIQGAARVFVFWDDDGKPTGAAATRIKVCTDNSLVGELHWQAGDGMAEWLPACLPAIEQILKRDHGVKRLRATGRPGLERALKPFGYRRVKVILEKGAGDA